MELLQDRIVLSLVPLLSQLGLHACLLLISHGLEQPGQSPVDVQVLGTLADCDLECAAGIVRTARIRGFGICHFLL